jgi:hypothetical protein
MREKYGIMSRAVSGIALVAVLWAIFYLVLFVWKIPTY